MTGSVREGTGLVDQTQQGMYVPMFMPGALGCTPDSEQTLNAQETQGVQLYVFSLCGVGELGLHV